MKHAVEANKNRVAKAIGRREFLLGALATTGFASTRFAGDGKFLLARRVSAKFLDAVNSKGTLASNLTPNGNFFIRNHFRTPMIQEDKWSLEVGGMAEKPVRLSYSDLLLASSVRRPLTLECAGNLSGGAGVSTALWSGLPLATLLKDAGVRPGATTVIFHGADSGEGEGVPAGTHFVRAIPLEKAMDPTTMLAYEMNGAPLPPEHGFPLRALVPGWYGMDSVKWLTRIELSQEPFQGYFQQKLYVALKSNGGREPITRMRVNSKFLRPLNDEEIRSKAYRVEGFAWAGERKIAKVELRFEGGGAWLPAVLGDEPAAMLWTPWSYEWSMPRAGEHSIEVRATDDAGNSQPLVRDPDRKDEYELNSPHRISVKVGS
jgi:DMSO/TMAO reductase YedYZ molybdopterin-dependent catalytic subunit